MPGHRDGARIDLHATADPEIEHAELGQRQSLRRAVESAGASRIGRAVSRPTFFLECRIGTACGEEIHEGGLEMTQRLLQRDRRHVIQKCQLWVSLQQRQFFIASRIGEPLATLEGGRSGSQHAVIDQATTAEGPGQMLGLRVGGIRPEIPATCHVYHLRVLSVRIKRRFLPAVNDGASAPETNR